ncbi:hypothetical protein ACFX12_012039 [Malus domestica]
MANPRRVAMVAKQIKRDLSDMLLTDEVLQYPIPPEVSLGDDRYLSSLTTISDVEVSTDLQETFLMNQLWGRTLSWKTHGCSVGVLVSRANTNEEHSRARTFSCLPTVATEKTSGDSVLSQKLSLLARKESFKKRKTDKVQINKPIPDGHFLLKRARSIEWICYGSVTTSKTGRKQKEKAIIF